MTELTHEEIDHVRGGVTIHWIGPRPGKLAGEDRQTSPWHGLDPSWHARPQPAALLESLDAA